MSELTDLETEIEAAILASRNHVECKMCVALREMSGARRELIQRALDSSIGHIRLVSILRKNGIDIGRPMLTSHRTEGHTT